MGRRRSGWPVAAGRTAASLDLLGSALYRAGQYEQAIETLKESIRLQGSGGYVDSWAFLAMACQRTGRGEEARAWFDRFEGWYQHTKLDDWLMQTRFRLLREQVRSLVLKMPPTQ